MASIVVMDLVLMQNARTAAAAMLPPITTLPPTMVMPQIAATGIKKNDKTEDQHEK